MDPARLLYRLSFFTSCHTVFGDTQPPSLLHTHASSGTVRAPWLVCATSNTVTLFGVQLGLRRPLGPTLIIRGEFGAHVWVVLITPDTKKPSVTALYFVYTCKYVRSLLLREPLCVRIITAQSILSETIKKRAKKKKKACRHVQTTPRPYSSSPALLAKFKVSKNLLCLTQPPPIRYAPSIYTSIHNYA